MTFFKFVFQPSNRNVLLAVFLFHVLIAILFNWAYPFAVYSYDTPNYMMAAQMHDFLGYRPYGYSAFINFCTAIWKSPLSIVFFQSFLFLIASLCFIFTIHYFFPFRNKKYFFAFVGLTCISFNPFFLNNVLISDSLFNSLALLWICTVIHIIHLKKISYPLFLLSFLLAFVAAKVRYAGLIFPLIGVITMLIVYRKKLPALAIGAGGFLLIFFLIYNRGVSQNKEKYGIDIFSAFGGWAQLNNASVTIPKAKNNLKDRELSLLQEFFKRYSDSLYTTQKVLTGTLMWDKQYPEKIYSKFIAKRHPELGYLTCYVYCGKLYSDYAKHLIKNNTSVYLSKYYFPNLGRVIYPAKDDVNGDIHQRTDKNTAEVCGTDFNYFVARKDIFGKLIAPWSGIKYFFLALCFLCLAGYFVFKKGLGLATTTKLSLYFFITFFFINSLFLTYTHPVLQRYLIIHEFIFIAVIFILTDALTSLKANRT